MNVSQCVMVGRTKEKTLHNFLVNFPRRKFFLKSINSSYTNIGEKLFELLNKFVEKIGAEKMVQVVTGRVASMFLSVRILVIEV